MRWPRLIILLVGLGALVAAFLLDGSNEVVAERSNPFVLTARPRATGEEFVATWVCPVLTSAGSGVDTEAQLVLVNPLDVGAMARITFEGRSTPSETVTMSLGASSRTVVDTSALPSEAERAVLVEVSHRSVVVATTSRSEQGEDSAPCGNQVSDQLTVASGSTRVDATEVLVLYNPFADDAVVDVRAASDAEFGFFDAVELQGLVVPAGSIRTVSLDDAVRRRDVLSLYVTLRKGRVVAARLMEFDGTGERRGFSADLASPVGSDVWYLPVGPRTEIEQLVLFNPGDLTAEVDIEVQAGAEFVPPLQKTVPPNDSVIVDLSIEADGLETGMQHGIVVRTQNGVEVAVDLLGGEDLEVAQSSDRLASFDMSAGADRAVTRWIVPTVRADETVAGVLIVQNPSDAPVKVTVETVGGGSLSVVETLSLGARSVQVVDLALDGDAALLVTGDGEIVVASALSEARPSGSGWAAAVPLEPSRG